MAEYPTFKSGLWKITNTPEGQAPQSSENCIDENTQKRLTKLGENIVGGTCTGLEMNKKDDAYVSNSTCDIAGHKMVTSSTYSGDFQQNFKFETNTKITPPMMGKGESKMSGTGEYVGACPADMKPGDTKLANGQIINPEEMMKSMPKDFMKDMVNMMNKMPKQK